MDEINKDFENITIHIHSLIIDIEEQVEEFSPLRRSNSFLKLKEFIDSEFKRKYKVGEDFKSIFK